ncbi:MAG TPA: cyclic nucleotide-binding domain-containing protein [Acidimicrobiales bacterium]|nr:cyclic nucleotide-binding domain-containing protein [Acidimicrobiales bacterium]
MAANVDDKRKRLEGIELFKHCTPEDLEALTAITEERALPVGHVLCDQGRVAQECYIVVDGQADVTISGRHVASIGPGESVGEMGLLDHLPRSATVTATTPMQVYVIEAKRFEQVLQSSGVARALLVLLSRRIRDLEHGREGLSAGY